MRPGLQTPASVNAILRCQVRPDGRPPCHVGLRYIKAPLANFAIRAG